MKNVSFLLFILILFIQFTSCVAEKIVPQVSAKQLDTIITFDPVTFEETVQVVESEEKNSKPKVIESYRIQVDTIITFDSDTYEETIQVVKTRVKINDN